MGVIIEVRNPLEDLEKKIRAHKRKYWTRFALTLATILLAMASTYLLLALQTYSGVNTVKKIADAGQDNSNYAQYSDGILKYSRDGIAFLDRSGTEKWNQSYQIKNPFLNIYKDSLAVADRDGNDILVFNKKGLRGEIHTKLPIESIVVSEQGIVCALLKNENSPQIICYDAMGNILVEHKSSISGTGYPIGMAISPDGYSLQVSYLCITDGVEATKVVYYDFETVQSDADNYQMTEDIYKNTIMPTSFFVDDKTSIIIGDTSFLIYKGKKEPKLSKTITLDKEIKSVFHNEKAVGFVLKNGGQDGYELRVYNVNGSQVLSKNFTGEYNHVKIADGEVMLYDGMKCLIFSSWGVKRFEGEVSSGIMEIFPVAGMNKYLVMSATGIEEVRVVK